MAEKTPTLARAGDALTLAVRDLELSYQASDEERRVKALFFTLLDENPVCDRKNITLAAIEQLTNDSRVSKWWGKPGFKQWFCNHVEVAAKAEFILDKLLDSFRMIADSEDPKSFGAKVQAAKLLADMRGHTAKATKTRVLDAEIPQTQEELEAYVSKLESATGRK